MGGYKYKKQGDLIHYNDQIIMKHEETSMFLHVSERSLGINNNQGETMEKLENGISVITPKKIDRREPPNMFVPHMEVNVSGNKTKFQVMVARYHDEDSENDERYLKGGMSIRLLHSEKGGFLHSDDKDFTDDGLAEVYLWNFKGKSPDLEANSSSSLFEIEIANPFDP
jgi:hypothetical protein